MNLDIGLQIGIISLTFNSNFSRIVLEKKSPMKIFCTKFHMQKVIVEWFLVSQRRRNPLRSVFPIFHSSEGRGCYLYIHT